ncbi:ThiF family adenylyltransferase [Mesoterricola sediminis]|uniref:Sulfur carrier protein ThiS adenylyltransferase n=1 Tax=Mesoterricola sediminis TaxID=2927980 RepID=A0AA48KEX7_9BACT|nr:ThiF family adenylyltransferase [Mesoterricola sediminis]BDU78500.1 sulfur carrier protein ThiS adenylyltransferase [Mesoterricola sediminis]
MSDRYAKQRIFLGPQADTRLRTRRVAVVGVGATGSVIASWLARAGVGLITLIDRDIVETSNLQRQILFQERDLFRPKAEVAAARLREANSEIDVIPAVTDLTSGNARELLAGYDLIMDGTDNFEARYLINDYAILHGTPWVYAGAIGGEGLVWPIQPPRTPCLRCLMEEPPQSGDVDTCDTAGVLGPAVGIVGSWAALEGLKLLTGEAPQPDLARFDFWRNERQFLTLPATRCRFCTDRVTEFLNARWTVKASRLCGLDGVQIRVNPPGALDLDGIRTRVERRTGSAWKLTPLSLAGKEGEISIMVFRDGRALFHGDITPERARSWYTEVVGC